MLNIMKRLGFRLNPPAHLFTIQFVLLKLEIMPNFHKKVGQRESDMKKENMKEEMR